jgi:hypothetical protein
LTTTPTKDYRSVWTYLMRTPFRQDYIDVRGLKTRYVEAGHPGSPAVFLLHGTGGHWENQPHSASDNRWDQACAGINIRTPQT